MSFVLSELTHIVNTLDDSLSMSEIQSKVSVSGGYHTDEYDNEEAYMKFFFSLKNGNAEIKICDSTATFSYLDRNGQNLQSIEFDDNSVDEINGSFRKALKQIWAFDRQNISSTQSTNTSVNRASFGLAEVN
jgi:hypothetical protein